MKKMSLEEKSITAYRSDLRNFYDYMKKITNEENEIEMLKSIDNDKVEDYIHYMDKELNNSITTINRMIATIKAYGKYLCNTKRIIEFNFAEGMEKIKPNANSSVKQKGDKEVLTKTEYDILIKASYIREKNAKNFDFNSSRFRFMLSLAITTGLRIDQMIGIREKKNIIKKDYYYLLILDASTNKCNKPIRVPICGVTLKYFNEYLVELNKIKNREEDFLFVSHRGKKLDAKAANVQLQTITKRTDIGKHFTFHCGRGSFERLTGKIGMNSNFAKLCAGWAQDGQSSTYFKDGEDLDEDKKLWIEKILG